MPTCGSANEPVARFCGSCGSALEDGATRAAAARSATSPVDVSERRLVSVLFADLVGFKAFPEGRDVEEVRTLQDRYFTVPSRT
jgi:adenylate cyclase